MSILIKGMEMPESCSVCELCGCYKESKGEVYRCDISMYVIKYFEKRLDNCPLVEVPPHGRLIDADKTHEVLSEYYHHRTGLQHEALKEALNRVPTIIEGEKE